MSIKNRMKNRLDALIQNKKQIDRDEFISIVLSIVYDKIDTSKSEWMQFRDVNAMNTYIGLSYILTEDLIDNENENENCNDSQINLKRKREFTDEDINK